MSKREILLRHSAIIKRLKRSPATFKEINDFLIKEGEIQEYNLKVSIRTFQRDIDDIQSLYQIYIEYDFSKNTYCIVEHENEHLSDRMLEAFDTYNILSSSLGFSNYIDFERRKSKGLTNFYSLLQAIKKKQQLGFTYQKHWEEEGSKRIVEPYFLKEFKNLWYLIAKDISKQEIRIYGLDRMSDLELYKKKLIQSKQFKPEEYFKDSFGIISKSEYTPPLQDIILWFNPSQGKYIKSYPLHSTQEVLEDNAGGLLIKLRLYITFDFEMELLSHGSAIKVLEPLLLRDSIKGKLQEALRNYD